MNLSNLDFQQARVKHILFKSKLRSALYGGKVDDSVFSQQDNLVGEWLQKTGIPKYGSRIELKQMEQAYREMQNYARNLISLYRRGKIEEARDGLSYIEKYSDKFLELLSTLEQEA